jgi:hypothetical protein
MQTIEQMMASSPNQSAVRDRKSIIQCVEACLECEQACVACADACLAEENVDALRRCIRLNSDCADICGVTARMLSRLVEGDPDLIRAQVDACARACATCGAECHRHAAHHEHCRICMEACQRCERACRTALGNGAGARA